MIAGDHVLAGAMWSGTDAKTAEDRTMTGATSANADEVQNSHSATTANNWWFSARRVLLHHQLASVLDSLSDLPQ